MVLKGAGPKGYPGFAEVGNMPLPKKVLQKGITDMVRISDGRMSGTAYGAVVLHVSPEAAAGGPLAFVQTGDMIELDVEARRLHLEVSDDELERAAARVAKARQPGARLLQALRRSRPASGPGRRPRFSGRLQRRTGAARFALIAIQIEWTKVLADAIMNRIGFFIAESKRRIKRAYCSTYCSMKRSAVHMPCVSLFAALTNSTS